MTKRLGRLEERAERQHAQQQHGDRFAVASEQQVDTSGVPVEDELETRTETAELEVSEGVTEERGPSNG